jgi:signal transduction histidine kinase
MRERIQLYGGRLEAGPRAEGGFVVRAWIPLNGTAR